MWGAESAFSNTVTPGTQPPPVGGLPGAPTIGTAVNGVTTDSAISATAKWSPPANNGGAAITGYRVKAIRVTSAGTTNSAGQTPPDRWGRRPLQLKFTGLLDGAFYKFEVQASNTPSGRPSGRVLSRPCRAR